MSREAQITAYFYACNSGSAADIAACFTVDAVIFDTNVAPFRGAAEIGRQWVRVRERWGGARWSVNSCVENGDAAAIEWAMTGQVSTGEPFTLRGSEHYRFAGELIDEIRQYWTFDTAKLDSGLRGYDYDTQ